MTITWRAMSLTGAVAAIALSAISVLEAASRQTARPAPTLHAAQLMFYDARYADAAEATRELCLPEVIALPACEVRSSALLFQLRRALGEAEDKDKAFKQCDACSGLLTTFVAQTRQAQTVARAHLKAHPDDEEALFYLGKMDLNYVWLQLGTLGKKTGWNEYWEARRSLDQVLKTSPGNIRAKVARAWIDYIVDTKMPFATKWLLGGGDKKKGLQAVQEAAAVDADLFIRAETRFALWDMQMREKNTAGALETAKRLAVDFPENVDVRKFLADPVQFMLKER